DGGGAADFRVGDEPQEVGWIVDRLAVERDDHVARLQAGAISGRAAIDLIHERPARLADPDFSRELSRQRVKLHPSDRSAMDHAIFDELVTDPSREIARHSEADALIASARRDDAGVDA